MQRKLTGYFLLSFLSFCVFTGVFHAVASAQATTSPATSPLSQSDPTPTIFEDQPKEVLAATQTSQQQPLPTPTIYSAPKTDAIQKPLAATTQETQKTDPSKDEAPASTRGERQGWPTSTIPFPTATPAPTAVPTAEPTAAPAVQPAAATTASGISEEALNYLGNCETGMTPTRNSGNGYYGAFQFSAGTWNRMQTGYERADLAPIEVQREAVKRLLQQSSIYTQFPACANKMKAAGLI